MPLWRNPSASGAGRRQPHRAERALPVEPFLQSSTLPAAFRRISRRLLMNGNNSGPGEQTMGDTAFLLGLIGEDIQASRTVAMHERRQPHRTRGRSAG